MIRPSCTYFLLYAGRPFCKHVWITNIKSDPVNLDEKPGGCGECKDYEPRSGGVATPIKPENPGCCSP